MLSNQGGVEINVLKGNFKNRLHSLLQKFSLMKLFFYFLEGVLSKWMDKTLDMWSRGASYVPPLLLRHTFTVSSLSPLEISLLSTFYLFVSRISFVKEFGLGYSSAWPISRHPGPMRCLTGIILCHISLSLPFDHFKSLRKFLLKYKCSYPRNVDGNVHDSCTTTIRLFKLSLAVEMFQ